MKCRKIVQMLGMIVFFLLFVNSKASQRICIVSSPTPEYIETSRRQIMEVVAGRIITDKNSLRDWLNNIRSVCEKVCGECDSKLQDKTITDSEKSQIAAVFRYSERMKEFSTKLTEIVDDSSKKSENIKTLKYLYRYYSTILNPLVTSLEDVLGISLD